MESWERSLINDGATLREALEALNSAGCKMLMVVTRERRLLGTLSDGDVRRSLLRGASLTDCVDTAMNPKPHVAAAEQLAADILSMMRREGLYQIPILDSDGTVVGLRVIDDYISSRKRENWVVIMAGGLGSRLNELTRSTPKPMLKVGPRPLLETIVRNYVASGFSQIYIAVNYLSEQIEAYFGDGSQFEANIQYLRETKRMGTAGALTLLPDKPTAPLIVTNADVLTQQDLGRMLDEHEHTGADATMGVRQYDMQVPFGVVSTVDGQIVSIEEKPMHSYSISAGLYVLSPHMLEHVPKDCFFDMPELFEAGVRAGLHARAYNIEGYWLDVGHVHEYERANAEFDRSFS